MEHFFFHRMEFIVGILFFYYIRLLHIFCLLWPFNIYPSLISTEKKNTYSSAVRFHAFKIHIETQK